jgi:hypothetical protein
MGFTWQPFKLKKMVAGFNWIRIVRLVAGGAVIYQAVLMHNTILGVLGAILLLQGIFNVGCLGASCAPPVKRSTSSTTDEIQFEEVK